MAPKNVVDQYANVAYLSMTHSTPQGLDFARLDIVSGALLGEQKFGLHLLRAEFYAKHVPAMSDFIVENDFWAFGLCVTDALADTGLHHPEVLSQTKMGNYLMSSPGGNVNDIVAARSIEPIVQDFASFGGILVPADRLYLYSDFSGSAAGGAGGEIIECRLFYTTSKLTTEQYWELIEARRIITT